MLACLHALLPLLLGRVPAQQGDAGFLLGEISFARFKQELALTHGNLGAQLRRLADDGYLALRRDFVEHGPVTWYALSKPGHKVLDIHLAAPLAAIAASGV